MSVQGVINTGWVAIAILYPSICVGKYILVSNAGKRSPEAVGSIRAYRLRAESIHVW